MNESLTKSSTSSKNYVVVVESFRFVPFAATFAYFSMLMLYTALYDHPDDTERRDYACVTLEDGVAANPSPAPEAQAYSGLQKG